MADNGGTTISAYEFFKSFPNETSAIKYIEGLRWADGIICPHCEGRPQIFNTDQGSQFTSEAFTSMLLAQGVQVSMDGRGRCMDNVFVERLWRSIKYEEVYLKAYQNGTEARKGIGAYLAFYNQERPHQALGYRSPGQVFQAVSPQRCLLELPRALPSDEGLRDTPAVDSLIFSLTAVLMMGST